MWLQWAVQGLVDLVVPSRCVGCGQPGPVLCRRCLPSRAAVPVEHPSLAVCAAQPYGGAVRTALVSYKERGRRDLAPALAALLSDAVIALGAGPDVALVGVPSARAVARARGGDHVARLARLAARQCGRPVVAALRQVRAVRDSAGLGVSARRANVAGSLAAAAPVSVRRAVIVDDIVTTGSTLGEAARALGAAGWLVVGAAVVAATPRGQP